MTLWDVEIGSVLVAPSGCRGVVIRRTRFWIKTLWYEQGGESAFFWFKIKNAQHSWKVIAL